jgi:hypothetical protein
MSASLRCPHCKAELPEKAAFCANCGRRIEGWSVSKDATPATGSTALPGGDEKTRQMQPTPSLLRAAAVSVKKKQKRRAVNLPLVVGMLIVAIGGGLSAFFLVRAHVRRTRAVVHAATPPAPRAVAPPIARPVAPSAVPSVAASHAAAPSHAVAPTAPSASQAATKTLVRKNKIGKRAHVIASAPVAVKARHSSSGGLPHKTVATDSKPLTMPTAPHETTGQSGAPATTPPSEADDKQEAQAGVDADSVRFVVQQHLPQVRACYGRAFKDSSPGGSVEIGFAIDPTGRAKNVRTETNTTDSEQLAHCLEQRVKEWQFPRPVGGDYELIYPFVFAPGS